MAAGWLSLGLGVFQEVHGQFAAGGNGVMVESNILSYHIADGHVTQGTEQTFPVVQVAVLGTHMPDPAAGEDAMAMIAACHATISCTGHFAAGGEHPPAIDNVQLWCSHQDGNWGTGHSESEVLFSAAGLGTPVGTPENPLLEFRCRLELKIPTYDNVIVHFPIYISSWPFCSFGDPHFEYGKCDVFPMGTVLTVQYDADKHATRDGGHL